MARRSTSRRAHARAFSLMEVVIVLSILAVTAAVAVPRFTHAQARYRTDLAARRIASDVALARSIAERDAVSRTIVFDVAQNSYTISGISDPDDPSIPTYTVKLGEGPWHASIDAAWFGAGNTVSFDGFGDASHDGVVLVTSGSVYRGVIISGSEPVESRQIDQGEALTLKGAPPSNLDQVGSTNVVVFQN